MGGCLFEDDYEFSSPLTLVLVGKTGNGKSATGNSIIGLNKFQSKRSSSGVTTTSELKTAVLEDGRVINVIDTPGLFDSSVDHEFIVKEIVSCIDMARNGIHAVLLVFSICNRFSEEEKSAISSLLTLFGRKIYDYIVVVFSGGDDLEDDGTTLEDYLCNCPEALKETLSLCGNRYVLFDNKTKDEAKKLCQVNSLLSLVNKISLENGGKPYSNEMFTEFKKSRSEDDEHPNIVRDQQFKLILELVESRLKETNLKLEQLLAEERAAREKAEKKAEAAKKEADEERHKMREEMERAEKREEDHRKQIEEERKRQEENQRKRDEEQQEKYEEERKRQEEDFRKREEEIRKQAAEKGCVIL